MSSTRAFARRSISARASSWTAELEPLVSTASVVDVDEPIVAGFDRLYVRIKSQNLLAPIDARTAEDVIASVTPRAVNAAIISRTPAT